MPIVSVPTYRTSTRHSRRPPTMNTERVVPGAGRQPRICAIAECVSWTVTLPKSTRNVCGFGSALRW